MTYANYKLVGKALPKQEAFGKSFTKTGSFWEKLLPKQEAFGKSFTKTY